MGGKRKTSRKTQPKTQELTVEPVSEPEPEPVPEPVSEPVVNNDNSEVQQSEPVEEVDEITQLFNKIQEQDAQILALQKERAANHKTLERLVAKDRKKHNKKKRVQNPDRKPSGFAKPSLLSDELCKFMSKPKGTQLARTEVTKYITGYIKDHELQDPSFKRRILPDTKLKKLLNVPKNTELTYFNLQTYMKHHFPKPVVASS